MRIVLLSLATLVLAACGGLLSEDEKTTTTNDPRDGGPVSVEPTGPADGATPPNPGVDVASLRGLALWLDATKGITLDASGAGIATWADQSPEHNDLKFHEGSGARANGTLGAGGVGATAIQFDGTTSYVISPSAKLASWSGDFYLAAVIHPNATSGFHNGIFSCYGPQPDVPGFTMTQFYVSDDHHACADVESDGYTDNVKSSALGDSAVVVAFRRTGTKLEARRNGFVDKTETTVYTTTPKCTQAFVGALPSDGTSATDAFFTGSIAELLVVQGSVSDTVAAGIEAELMSKYLLSH
ncbi:MAG: hypothetical protein ABI551_05765 [Polyangiaceae bacterium]